jgi:hypothetical protein
MTVPLRVLALMQTARAVVRVGNLAAEFRARCGQEGPGGSS